MNKLLLIALLALASCAKRDYFAEFQSFVAKFGKKYDSFNEYNKRYHIFISNMEKIRKRNRKYEGVTRFSDLTEAEFRKTYLNLDISKMNKNAKKVLPKVGKKAPDTWDWREQGAVAYVKDQGGCGSCWAFSAVANIEGQYFLKHSELIPFSEQQLVDCDTIDSGCNGGWMMDAFNYLIDNGGIVPEDDYPYVGYDESCEVDLSKVKCKLTADQQLDSQDETVIRDFLYETGPLSVALNADPLSFYSGGIIDADAWECDPDALNHGVTLVGYGNEDGLDFWILKNSWGDYWGEDGYFRMARGKGTCGINTYVATSTVE